MRSDPRNVRNAPLAGSSPSRGRIPTSVLFRFLSDILPPAGVLLRQAVSRGIILKEVLR